jgi:predicted dehydrogenase
VTATTPHRVGVIGANAKTSWAAYSHLPAIVAAENVRLSAIATTNPRSAEESAKTFGATHAFADAADLVACDDVDLVVVSVKSPGPRVPPSLLAPRRRVRRRVECPRGAAGA